MQKTRLFALIAFAALLIFALSQFMLYARQPPIRMQYAAPPTGFVVADKLPPIDNDGPAPTAEVLVPSKSDIATSEKILGYTLFTPTNTLKSTLTDVTLYQGVRVKGMALIRYNDNVDGRQFTLEQLDRGSGSIRLPYYVDANQILLKDVTINGRRYIAYPDVRGTAVMWLDNRYIFTMWGVNYEIDDLITIAASVNAPYKK